MHKWNEKSLGILLRFASKNDGPWNDPELYEDDDSGLPGEHEAELICMLPDLLNVCVQLNDYLHGPSKTYQETNLLVEKLKQIVEKANGKD